MGFRSWKEMGEWMREWNRSEVERYIASHPEITDEEKELMRRAVDARRKEHSG